MNANRRNGPRSERGFSFVLVLILMLVGVLVLTAVLRYMGTGLKAAEVHQQKMGEFYAADSGLNDGLWRIKNDRLSPTYDNYDYSGTAWTYVMNDGANPVLVNGENVSISISNEWMVKDLTPPGNAQAVIEGSGTTVPQLLVVGIVDAVPTATLPGTFRIKLVYTGAGNPAFSVQTVGIWLPPGYTYAGTSSLDPPAPAPPLYSSVSTEPWKSGTALVWGFSAIPFGNLPRATDPVNERNITFQFNGPTAGKPPAIAWVDTSLNIIGGTRFTWDGDKKVYAISATAGQTTLTQHNLKVDLRQMAAAILGDYVATGGTLMTMSNHTSPPIRDTPLTESSATVNSIPQDASVAVAYLYWAGWLKDQSQTIDLGNRNWTVGSSSGWGTTPGTNFHDPFNGRGVAGPESARTITLTNPENLSSYPSGDLTLSWDQSMFTSSSGPYYKLFTFTPFEVPAGVTINDLRVYVTSRRSGSGPSDIRACINVGGTRYNDPNPNNPSSSSSFNTDSYSWTTNPAGGDWTPAAINAIQQFGVYSNDLTPNVQVTSVYAVVNYSLMTRAPTADTANTRGTWSGSPFWSKVNDQNDDTYITGNATDTHNHNDSAFKTFSFSSFSLTAGTDITDLTVHIRARRLGDRGSDIRETIRVYGNDYNGPSDNPTNSSSFGDYSNSWDRNPYTNSAWTVADLNGTGSRPLQEFGVYSSDLDPDVLVSMIYAEVNCSQTRVPTGDGGDTFGTWDSAPLSDKVDELPPNSSDYITGRPSSGPSLTEDDKLYFELTNNNSFTPGDPNTFIREEALNVANPHSPYSYVIPPNFRTIGFRMRFVFDCVDSSKRVQVDNVRINYQPVSVDNTAYLEIGGDRVYFNAGEPQIEAGGTQVLTSTDIQTIPSEPDSGTWYCAKVDVTRLVQAFSDNSTTSGATNHPGNGIYTVGGVNATSNANSQIAYAGWSLVIVYSSPDTLGHQLYLYDTFRKSNNDGNSLLSFPMGGFLVPERIQGETLDADAAKLTAFVLEGDEYYSGDYLALNGTKLSDGTTSSSLDNVWNDRSLGLNADGVDIDTFHVPWSSNLLHTGDTSANVDIHTHTDIWELAYIIISFRSEVTVGGSLSFLIE
jgi:hypothetical protein